MIEWVEFNSKKRPDNNETVLILSISPVGTPMVQFATYHQLNGESAEWDLYELLDGAKITHFARFTPLPQIYQLHHAGRVN